MFQQQRMERDSHFEEERFLVFPAQRTSSGDLNAIERFDTCLTRVRVQTGECQFVVFRVEIVLFL